MKPDAAPRKRYPARVVALGGGTGMPAVLRGLRELVVEGRIESLTAIVTMSDDGGSSGRLRRTRGVLPPGDVRNCLVALSPAEDLLAELFQHRYDGGGELGGHTLGNLFLAALAEQTGSFLRAVEESSRVLRTVGRILPVTLEDVTLEAELVDGRRLRGESRIGGSPSPVARVSLTPESARPTPGVVEALSVADLIVLGPGSLFTSVAPNLVLPEIAHAMCATRAVRVLVGNLVRESSESRDIRFEDHIRMLSRQAGGKVVDALLTHDGPIDDATVGRYQAEGATPLTVGDQGLEGIHVVRGNLLARDRKLRHDPQGTVDGLLAAWRDLTRDVVKTGGSS